MKSLINNVPYLRDCIMSFCRSNSITESCFLACTITLPIDEGISYTNQLSALDGLLEALGLTFIATLEYTTVKNTGWHYHFVTSSNNLERLQKQVNVHILKGYDLQGWIRYITKKTYAIKENECVLNVKEIVENLCIDEVKLVVKSTRSFMNFIAYTVKTFGRFLKGAVTSIFPAPT